MVFPHSNESELGDKMEKEGFLLGLGKGEGIAFLDQNFKKGPPNEKGKKRKERKEERKERGKFLGKKGDQTKKREESGETGQKKFKKCGSLLKTKSFEMELSNQLEARVILGIRTIPSPLF